VRRPGPEADGEQAYPAAGADQPEWVEVVGAKASTPMQAGRLALVVACGEMADQSAAADELAAGDGGRDWLIGGAETSCVLDGDQRTVHEQAREHHGSVACRVDGLAREAAEVDPTVAGAVRRSGRDEGPYYGVRCERPREA
jgi:hypothetical protein